MRRGRLPLYPWDLWFAAGRSFLIRRGRDYTCSDRLMRQQARNAASKRGVSIQTEETDDGISVRVVKEVCSN